MDKGKLAIPLLGGIRIETADGGQYATLSATNLDQFGSVRVLARIDEGGVACIPASALGSAIKTTSGNKVHLASMVQRSKDKSGKNIYTAKVIHGESKMSIPAFDPESFPVPPDASELVAILPASEMRRMIDRVGFAISKEESRFTLSGCLFELGPQHGRMVATDGHRLSLASTSIVSYASSEGLPKMTFLLPKQAMATIEKVFDRGDIRVEVCRPTKSETSIQEKDKPKTGVTHLRLSNLDGSIAITARPMSGTFPDYERVLPKNYCAQTTVSRDALLAASARVITAHRIGDVYANGNPMLFTINGMMKVSALYCDSSLFDETIPSSLTITNPETANYTDNTLQLCINAEYVREVLAALPVGDEVTMHFCPLINDPGHGPSYVQGVGVDSSTDSSFRHVVMTMRF